MSNNRLYMLSGLPGSGKSTWAIEQVHSDRSYIRVNKDDLRDMCHGGKWDPKREKQILLVRDAMIEVALRAGRNVIVDDTNLHPKHEQRLREIAELCKVDFEVKHFDVSVDDCIARDAKRAHPVGEQVIRDMWRSFIRVTPEPQQAGLPPAIIVDIDGTLAIMGKRSPYDDHLADCDTLNTSVFDAMQAWLLVDDDRELIIMSGRDEGRSRDVTKEWLQRHHIFPDMLLMRPADDVRKDAVVKRELFETHVKGKRYIHFVLDDRDQVVRMWRDELGLQCFQVAPGNF
jgi:predicted kinase